MKVVRIFLDGRQCEKGAGGCQTVEMIAKRAEISGALSSIRIIRCIESANTSYQGS